MSSVPAIAVASSALGRNRSIPRQVRFAWAERVLEQPGLSITLRPELYASRNSLANAPYFNPSVVFPIKEITPADPDEFLKTIRQAAQAYRDALD